jgi:pimeloyl-ACP methyl ester carboxylesterase
MTTDVIILHGAWHQPAHYADLATRLRERNLDVHVPDLYRLSLAESVAKVQAIADQAEQPPVIVGHSFGGVTAGLVKGAAAYLFLAAWVLEAGETPGGLIATVTEPAQLATTLDAEGLLHLDPEDARSKLYMGASSEDADRAVKLLRPEPPSIFAATPEDDPWRNGRSLYIAGRVEQTIPLELVELFASRCSESQTWETGHSPYLSHPAELTDLIAELA